MVDSLFEFLFLCTVLLTVTVLLRRLRHAERELDRAGAPEPGPRDAEGAEGVSPRLLLPQVSAILQACTEARAHGRTDEQLQVVERHARRLGDLLARASGSPQAPAVDLRELDPAALLREALEANAELARTRRVRVHLELDAAPLVESEPEPLQAALRHLVEAAIHCAPGGRGDVTAAVGLLAVAGQPGMVAFAVAADGPGLGPRERAALHDPQADPSVAAGSAVLKALASVRAHCPALRAALVIDSAPGAGVRATLKVPVFRESGRATSPAPAAAPRA